MEIAVDGWRAAAADWDAVRNVPVDELPPLTEQQQEVARKLGISDADYRRSAFAGERSREALLAKTERLARLLARLLRPLNADASVQTVTLRTFDEKFDITIAAGQRIIPVRISEDLVDSLFESGSEEAERRLIRILESAVPARIREQ